MAVLRQAIQSHIFLQDVRDIAAELHHAAPSFVETPALRAEVLKLLVTMQMAGPQNSEQGRGELQAASTPESQSFLQGGARSSALNSTSISDPQAASYYRAGNAARTVPRDAPASVPALGARGLPFDFGDDAASSDDMYLPPQQNSTAAMAVPLPPSRYEQPSYRVPGGQAVPSGSTLAASSPENGSTFNNGGISSTRSGSGLRHSSSPGSPLEQPLSSSSASTVAAASSAAAAAARSSSSYGFGAAVSTSAPRVASTVPGSAHALKGITAAAAAVAATTAAAAAASVSSAVAGTGAAAQQARQLVQSIGDLQRVGPAALQAAKAKMDVLFDVHRLAPGDPGYEYDRRVDFATPQEASDWDD